MLTDLRKPGVSCQPVYFTDTPKLAYGVLCDGVQMEKYENSCPEKAEKPWDGFFSFLKEYLECKGHDVAEELVHAGTLASA